MSTSVFNKIFSILEVVDALIWERIGLFLIIFTGLYLTFLSKGLQFRILFRLKKNFCDVFLHKSEEKNLCEDDKAGAIDSIQANVKDGVSPFGIYFASIGGMIGIGNIVGVVTAISIGGPGSLLWMWISSFIGMLVKYSEIYLGVKYRVYDRKTRSYVGGPMYYIPKAFEKMPKFGKGLSILMCLLFCFYGVEISQFVIISDTLSSSFSLNRTFVVISLIVLVTTSAYGGIKWLSRFCTVLMPPFMLSYIGFGALIIVFNYHNIPSVMREIFSSAFTFSSSAGGLIGTSLVAASYGTARAVYSGDIGIGYDSILHSETRTIEPERQAKMAIFSLLSDTIVCTFSVLIVLLTGIWKKEGVIPSEYIVEVFSMYLPQEAVKYYVAVLFFLSGITTLIGYFIVGNKTARFISHKWGAKIYLLYAICAFFLFSFLNQDKVMMLMSISGGLLMIMNIIGMFPLFKKVKF